MSGEELIPWRKEYEEAEKAALTDLLSKHLGPEYVSTRASGGGRVSYIEGWKMMNLANEVFGFNGWKSEIKSLSVDYIEEREGRVSLAVTSTIRVVIRDGAYREDIGFGSADNVRNKGQALEKAKKEAITDGIKRCFRQFGNLMGNCLYDKRYLQSVNRFLRPLPPLSEATLHRQAEFRRKRPHDQGSGDSEEEGQKRRSPGSSEGHVQQNQTSSIGVNGYPGGGTSSTGRNGPGTGGVFPSIGAGKPEYPQHDQVSTGKMPMASSSRVNQECVPQGGMDPRTLSPTRSTGKAPGMVEPPKTPSRSEARLTHPSSSMMDNPSGGFISASTLHSSSIVDKGVAASSSSSSSSSSSTTHRKSFQMEDAYDEQDDATLYALAETVESDRLFFEEDPSLFTESTPSSDQSFPSSHVQGLSHIGNDSRIMPRRPAQRTGSAPVPLSSPAKPR